MTARQKYIRDLTIRVLLFIKSQRWEFNSNNWREIITGNFLYDSHPDVARAIDNLERTEPRCILRGYLIPNRVDMYYYDITPAGEKHLELLQQDVEDERLEESRREESRISGIVTNKIQRYAVILSVGVAVIAMTTMI